MRSLKKIEPFSDCFFLKVLSFKEMRAIFALTVGQESVKWYAVAAVYKWQVVTVGWGVLIGGPSSTVAVNVARPTRHVQMRWEHTTKQKTERKLREVSYRYTDNGVKMTVIIILVDTDTWLCYQNSNHVLLSHLTVITICLYNHNTNIFILNDNRFIFIKHKSSCKP